MKHITNGSNELYFQILRDLPYFQPTTNYYGMTVKSFDSNVSKTFLVRDVSTSPDSYQHFLITGTTGTEYLEDAVVKLLPYGTWYLDIYAASGSTLNDVTTERLFSGLIKSRES